MRENAELALLRMGKSSQGVREMATRWCGLLGFDVCSGTTALIDWMDRT